MGTNRLEAFSDGVLAIIITIMVLELKVPHEPTVAALAQLWPVFLSYALSFFYVGIYWNNHHHLMHAAERVSAGVMWANLHLLFWISLLPFTTAWMGENDFAPLPTFFYGVDLLLCAAAFSILERLMIAGEGDESTVGRALGRDRKPYISLILYAIGLVIAWFWIAAVGLIFFAAVAAIWVIPDRRVEEQVEA